MENSYDAYGVTDTDGTRCELRIYGDDGQPIYYEIVKEGERTGAKSSRSRYRDAGSFRDSHSHRDQS
jgi:hypothetical protein